MAIPGFSLSWRIFLRSLFVQASWNFSRLQNLGFFLMVFPALVRRHPRGSVELVQASQRHLELFNTHPYFAGIVAGTVVHEEEKNDGTDLAIALKRSLMCSFGGLGDELFWAHLRPLAALLALPFALAGRAWAPVVLLAAYNIPHLVLRGWGVAAGLCRGREILTHFQRRLLERAIPKLGTALAVLGGFIVGISAGSASWGLVPGSFRLSAVAASGLFAAFVFFHRRGFSQERMLLALTALALLAGAARLAVAP